MPPKEQNEGSRRKYVGNACANCRSSKLKCDGTRPKCGNCSTKNRNCQYSDGQDKRRISLRRTVEILAARVRQLEGYVVSNGLEIPGLEGGEAQESELRDMLETLQIPGVGPAAAVGGVKSEGSSRPDSGLSMGEERGVKIAPAAAASATQTKDWAASGDAQSVASISNVGPSKTIAVDSGKGSASAKSKTKWRKRFKADTAAGTSYTSESSEDENQGGVIRELSSRLGTLQVAEDGQLRYYGATSNLNLLQHDSIQASRFESRSIRKNGQQLLEHAGVGQTVDPELEDHLIDLYFAWEDPSSHIVDREMYYEQRKLWKEGKDDCAFYSEVLTNAMCALGSAFETKRHNSVPRPLAEFFAGRAKALLDLELDSPCVATVQALAILSNHEAAFTRDARGWLYSGMSMRLAFDLGLHIDMSPYVQKGEMSAREAEVRRVAFWGNFITDHLWGFYLGRPFHISTEDISVRQPAIAGQLARVGIWRAYTTQDKSIPPRELRDPIDLITRQMVLLCDMMASLGHVLYGCRDISKYDLHIMSSQTTDAIFGWKDGLEAELQIDLNDYETPYLPHLLLLHMQYYQFVIYIHRPYVSKHSIQPYPPRGAGHGHARRTCIESAIAISKLLCIYKHRYTLRRINTQAIHTTFSAALILIFATVSDGARHQRNSELSNHLDVCCQFLAELGKVFENATRSLEVLLAVKRTWQAKLLVATGSKRRGPGLQKGAGGENKSARRNLAASKGSAAKRGSTAAAPSTPPNTTGATTTAPAPPNTNLDQPQTAPGLSPFSNHAANADSPQSTYSGFGGHSGDPFSQGFLSTLNDEIDWELALGPEGSAGAWMHASGPSGSGHGMGMDPMGMNMGMSSLNTNNMGMGMNPLNIGFGMGMGNLGMGMMDMDMELGMDVFGRATPSETGIGAPDAEDLQSQTTSPPGSRAGRPEIGFGMQGPEASAQQQQQQRGRGYAQDQDGGRDGS